MKKEALKNKRIVRGRKVGWTSQGRGIGTTKWGLIVGFISPGESALEAVPGRLKGALSRSKRNFKDISNIERYLIEVYKDVEGEDQKPVLYCALASLVKEVPFLGYKADV